MCLALRSGMDPSLPTTTPLVRKRFALLCFVVVAMVLVEAPTTVRACGGFFCDLSQPVVQSAEGIIFAHNEDGSTTAVIQVSYTGPSERFAWLLPVAGTPVVGVSSDQAFSRLNAATAPILQRNDVFRGDCNPPSQSPPPNGLDGGTSADAAFNDAASAPPPVTVVDMGSVGPYDYTTIQVADATEDKATAVTEWLEANSYDVNDFGVERLVPYLEAGMNLIAIRLSKSADVGQIRPITLSFGEGLPSIPLRATAAAATNSMGILVWVLGEHRAIAANYAQIELNWLRLNWLRPDFSYPDLVRQASREAGHGFVTEFSGDSSPLANRVWSEGSERTWQGLHDSSLPDGEALLAMVNAAPFQGVRDVLRMQLPPPPGVSEEAWIARPEAFLGDFRLRDRIEGFDAEAFWQAMDEQVVAPIRETAALFRSTNKTTRFYTTMAPEQMTLDPIFDFDPARGDISRQVSVTRTLDCTYGRWRNPPWRVEMGLGRFVYGSGNRWPFRNDSEMPAASRIVRLGPGGEEDLRVDNRALIEARLAEVNGDLPSQWGRPPIRPRADVEEDGDELEDVAGCAAVNAADSSGVLLALWALLWRRRRK